MKLTMREIRNRYHELRPDGHWFDKDTMRFFNTELPARGYLDIDGDIWFVTGETGPDGKKRFTLRRMQPNGSIGTFGEFQQYRERSDALAALHDHLAQGETA